MNLTGFLKKNLLSSADPEQSAPTITSGGAGMPNISQNSWLVNTILRFASSSKMPSCKLIIRLVRRFFLSFKAFSASLRSVISTTNPSKY